MTDFTMYSGDTKIIQVTLSDENGVPIDVTGVAITWQLSKKVSSSAILTKTVGNGISIFNGPAGRFDIAIDPADTASLKGDYYQEIQVNDANVISTVLTGTVTIQPDAIQ